MTPSLQALLPLAAGAEGPPTFLTQIAALVVAGAVVGYLCARLRIVPIVGFLLAGVLIGPNALGVVREREIIDAAAEVGVILLLFTIGIEFSLGRLMAIRRLVLLGGSVQVLSAVAVVTGVLLLAGVDARPAVFTGLLVSLSSTAIVLKLLSGRGGTGSPTGRTALGLLVFQDLAVVAMVLMLPILGGETTGTGGLLRAIGTAIGVIVVTLVVARRVMPKVLEAVARACSPEVFLLSVIALCLGTAYLTALAGVSVSLGAFLAGLVVSESRHSAHALGEVLPLQILFSATFFLSVGTLLDVGFLVEEPMLVLAAVALVLVVKTVTTFAAAVVTGVRVATAGGAALLLAQVGEFAFVLERGGRDVGLTPAGLGEDGSQAFIAATVLLLVATPGLAALGGSFDRWVTARQTGRLAAHGDAPEAPDEADDHVLISGWGGAARAVAADLSAAGIPVVVVTLFPDGAAEAEEAGLQVVRGDSTKEHVLRTAGAERARLVVIGDDDTEQAARIAGVVAAVAPGTGIVVLAEDPDAVAELNGAGVGTVVLADRAAHVRLSEAVLVRLRPGSPPARTVVDVDRVVAFRADPEQACVHAAVSVPVVPSDPGCAECLRAGERDWVHLRMCTSCGHVGCCDSSPARHAARHAADADHPVMCSVEPGDDWGWCFLDEQLLPAAKR